MTQDENPQNKKLTSTSKVSISVGLPSLLHESAGGQCCVTVEATTLAQCFQRLLERYPLLRRHLFTETGDQRPHVLFYYNEENTKWLPSLDIPLKAGDSLTILQAVSGG